ncbi:MAG: hypothetical protein M1833_005530 [Piccolia ochrophora]|nr:MAG: hypothetical protein M1833_005530 [Piccolia ochrophora]
MDWEHSQYGFPYSHGHPPTPSATPTSATGPTFDPSTFQTPKSAIHHFESLFPQDTSPLQDYPSSFDRTPQPNFYANPAAGPFDPSGHTKAYSNHERLNAQLASHTHHLSPHQGFPLPAVNGSRQLNSSPNPSPTSSAYLGALNAITPIRTVFTPEDSVMHSARSMQTPPPTSTSAAKRKKKQPTKSKPNECSTTGVKAPRGKKKATMQLQSDAVVGFSQPLQPPPFFSDPITSFDYPPSAPATAPVYPQHRLFWEPDTNVHATDFDLSAPDLPFPQNQSQVPNDARYWPATGHPGGSQADTQSAPIVHLNPTKQRRSSASKAIGAASKRRAVPASKRSSASTVTRPLSGFTDSRDGGVVNPNELYNIHSDPHNITSASNSAIMQAPTASKSRQPYKFQEDELRREKAHRESRKENQHRMKMIYEDSPPPQCVSNVRLQRPILKRSFTDAGCQAVSHVSLDKAQTKARQPSARDSLGISVSSHRLYPANSSPRATEGQSPPSGRTAVTFAIDSKGRARAETRLVDDPVLRHRSSPAKQTISTVDEEDSWDDSGSDSSSDIDFATTASRNGSFTFPQPPPQRPTFVRAGTASSSRLSFSSRPGVDDAEEEDNEDMREYWGNAQSALREVLEGRSKRRRR